MANTRIKLHCKGLGEGMLRGELVAFLLGRGVVKVRGDGGGFVVEADTDALRAAVNGERDVWIVPDFD